LVEDALDHLEAVFFAAALPASIARRALRDEAISTERALGGPRCFATARNDAIGVNLLREGFGGSLREIQTGAM
jgi:hypothetical protein